MSSETGPPTVQLDVVMTQRQLDDLDAIARVTGQGLGDVIGKALLLYKAAVRAKLDGKAVGIAASAEALEAEFTGL